MFWTMQANEMGNRMNRCQTLVSCRHTAPTLLFHFLQKLPHEIGRKIFNVQSVNRLAKATGGKGQQ
jgi:hypothetical protein